MLFNLRDSLGDLERITLVSWRVISVGVRTVACANLVLLAAGLIFPVSKQNAVGLFSGFRVSALVLLALVAAEFVLSRGQARRACGFWVDSFLVLLMFCVWFIIAAATL